MKKSLFIFCLTVTISLFAVEMLPSTDSVEIVDVGGPSLFSRTHSIAPNCIYIYMDKYLYNYETFSKFVSSWEPYTVVIEDDDFERNMKQYSKPVAGLYDPASDRIISAFSACLPKNGDLFIEACIRNKDVASLYFPVSADIVNKVYPKLDVATQTAKLATLLKQNAMDAIIKQMGFSKDKTGVEYRKYIEHVFHGDNNFPWYGEKKKFVLQWAKWIVQEQANSKKIDYLTVYALIRLAKYREAKNIASGLIKKHPDDFTLNYLLSILSSEHKADYFEKAFAINFEKSILLYDSERMEALFPRLPRQNGFKDLYWKILFRNLDKLKTENIPSIHYAKIQQSLRKRLISDWKHDVQKFKDAEKLHKKLHLNWKYEQSLINSVLPKKNSGTPEQNKDRSVTAEMAQECEKRCEEIQKIMINYHQALGKMPQNMGDLLNYMKKNNIKTPSYLFKSTLTPIKNGFKMEINCEGVKIVKYLIGGLK